MSYSIFVLQILISCFKAFYTVNISEPILQLIVLALISALLFLLYSLKINDFFILMFSFIINPYLLSISSLLNFLPYISMYFYILKILKKNDINTANIKFYLLPIILIGLFPINFKGVFETPVRNYFSNLLFSPSGTNGGNTIPGQSIPVPGSFNITDFFKNVISGGKAIDFNAPPFLVVFLSNLVLVLFVAMIFYSFKMFFSGSLKTVKKGSLLKHILIFLIIMLVFLVIVVNAPELLSLLSAFFRGQTTESPVSLQYKLIPLIVIFVVFSMIFIRNLRRNKRKDSRQIMNRPFSFFYWTFSLFGLFLIVFVFMNRGAFLLQSNLPKILALIAISLLITIVICLVVILIILRLNFKFAVPEQIFGEETRVLEKRYYERSPLTTLENIQDIKEFVIFFYFSALMILSEKGFNIESSETPYEYLHRMENIIALPNFAYLTEIFCIVKYSNHEISSEEQSNIRKFSFDTIDFLNNFDRISETNKLKHI
jgi:hypothetical protein